MNQQLMVRLVPRHTLQMRFFLILAQPLQARLGVVISTVLRAFGGLLPIQKDLIRDSLGRGSFWTGS